MSSTLLPNKVILWLPVDIHIKCSSDRWDNSLPLKDNESELEMSSKTNAWSTAIVANGTLNKMARSTLMEGEVRESKQIYAEHILKLKLNYWIQNSNSVLSFHVLSADIYLTIISKNNAHHSTQANTQLLKYLNDTFLFGGRSATYLYIRTTLMVAWKNKYANK